MDHSMMNHTDHSMHNHTGMDHSMHNHTGMDHSDHLGAHSGHSMKMYFHDGVNEFVLFKECETNSTETLVGACFIIFVVAVLYEGLKYLREILLQRSLLGSQPSTESKYELHDRQISTTSQEQMVMRLKTMSLANRMLSCGHFVQTLLHVVQVFVSYCLMLVFMTYNVWLCLAVVLGAGVGYFLFGWRRAVVVDANEHCH